MGGKITGIINYFNFFPATADLLKRKPLQIFLIKKVKGLKGLGFNLHLNLSLSCKTQGSVQHVPSSNFPFNTNPVGGAGLRETLSWMIKIIEKHIYIATCATTCIILKLKF